MIEFKPKENGNPLVYATSIAATEVTRNRFWNLQCATHPTKPTVVMVPHNAHPSLQDVEACCPEFASRLIAEIEATPHVQF